MNIRGEFLIHGFLMADQLPKYLIDIYGPVFESTRLYRLRPLEIVDALKLGIANKIFIPDNYQIADLNLHCHYPASVTIWSETVELMFLSVKILDNRFYIDNAAQQTWHIHENMNIAEICEFVDSGNQMVKSVMDMHQTITGATLLEL